MFEDLITTRKVYRTWIPDVNCPRCFSKNIKVTFGMFKSSIEYIECIKCLDCNKSWKIVYDEDLNIIRTEV
jgi:transposase-like protein